MKSAIAFVVVVVALAYEASAAIEGLGYITHYENKHYWEHTQPVTQEKASEFCRSIGFELVQIDSVEERNHLYSKIGSYDYWTSGVSIPTTQSFHWDMSWNEKNPVAIPINDIRPASGIYYSRNTLRTTQLTSSMRPLCQHVVCQGGCAPLK